MKNYCEVPLPRIDTAIIIEEHLSDSELALYDIATDKEELSER